MQKITFLLIVLALFVSCRMDTAFSSIKGNGNIVTEEISIDNYDEIHVNGMGDVNYSTSENSPFLTVKVDENILEYLDIYVKNRILVVDVKKQNSKSINIHPSIFLITTNSYTLNKIKINGSGEVNIMSDLKGDRLTMDISGSGDISTNENLDINNLDINISGSGGIYLKGVVSKGNAKILGSGEINSFDCKIESLDCTISGSGTIKTYIEKELYYRISGSGDLIYKGDPIVQGKVSGSGGIKKM